MEVNYKQIYLVANVYQNIIVLHTYYHEDHIEKIIKITNLIEIWVIGEDGYYEALWTIISAGSGKEQLVHAAQVLLSLKQKGETFHSNCIDCNTLYARM